MNQEKIGKFISKCRKDKNLTQDELADKLGISDRAVSKWETGLNLPDASLMIDLCSILGINVNELLTGEIIEKKDYMENAEKNLIKMKEQEEKSNKLLLMLEWVIGLMCSVTFFVIIFVVSFSEINLLPRVILLSTALIVFIVGMIFSLKIETEAGYYECKKCHHKYVPSYTSVLFAMHSGRTRYLKCPKCQNRSWNRKVLTK